MDVLCTRKLLERLTPSEDILSGQQNQFIWTNEVKELKPIVQNIIHFFRRNKHLFGLKSEDIITDSV